MLRWKYPHSVVVVQKLSVYIVYCVSSYPWVMAFVYIY
jgi:hypothetical protein